MARRPRPATYSAASGAGGGGVGRRGYPRLAPAAETTGWDPPRAGSLEAVRARIQRSRRVPGTCRGRGGRRACSPGPAHSGPAPPPSPRGARAPSGCPQRCLSPRGKPGRSARRRLSASSPEPLSPLFSWGPSAFPLARCFLGAPIATLWLVSRRPLHVPERRRRRPAGSSSCSPEVLAAGPGGSVCEGGVRGRVGHGAAVAGPAAPAAAAAAAARERGGRRRGRRQAQ